MNAYYKGLIAIVILWAVILFLCFSCTGCANVAPKLEKLPNVCPQPRTPPAIPNLPAALPSLPADLKSEDAANAILTNRITSQQLYQQCLQSLSAYQEWSKP